MNKINFETIRRCKCGGTLSINKVMLPSSKSKTMYTIGCFHYGHAGCINVCCGYTLKEAVDNWNDAEDCEEIWPELKNSE